MAAHCALHRDTMAAPVNDRVMFVDLSYLVLQRFYATRAWERFNARGERMEEAVLDAHFDTTLQESLHRLCALNNVPVRNVFFAKDCVRGKVWRVSYLESYKATRGRGRLSDGDDQSIERAFARTVDVLIPTWGGGARILELGRAEGDDIIAALARCKHFAAWHKVIVTNDSDMLQLCRADTTVVDVHNKHLVPRLGDLSPSEYLIFKVIRGDRSDNIPPVFRRCCESTAHALAKNPKLLEDELAISDTSRQQYAINNILINFDHVPTLVHDYVGAAVLLWLIG